jgi:propanediol dehydratase large subunit
MPSPRRFQLLEQRDVNRETFVEPWPEAGLIVADSPADPQAKMVDDGFSLDERRITA